MSNNSALVLYKPYTSGWTSSFNNSSPKPTLQALWQALKRGFQFVISNVQAVMVQLKHQFMTSWNLVVSKLTEIFSNDDVTVFTKLKRLVHLLEQSLFNNLSKLWQQHPELKMNYQTIKQYAQRGIDCIRTKIANAVIGVMEMLTMLTLQVI